MAQSARYLGCWPWAKNLADTPLGLFLPGAGQQFPRQGEFWVYSTSKRSNQKRKKKKEKDKFFQATSNIGKTNISFPYGFSGQLWILVMPQKADPFGGREKFHVWSPELNEEKPNWWMSQCTVSSRGSYLVCSSWFTWLPLESFLLAVTGRTLGGLGGDWELWAPPWCAGFVCPCLCSWHLKKEKKIFLKTWSFNLFGYKCLSFLPKEMKTHIAM